MAGLADQATGKMLHRLTVSEVVLKVLGRGANGKETLSSIAGCLSEKLHTLIPSLEGTVLKQTASELVLLGRGLKALLGEDGPDGDATAVEVMKTRFNVLRQLLAQNSFWREEEKRVLERRTAMATFGPEIWEIQMKVENGEALDATHLSRRVRVWDEALPSGSCCKSGVVAVWNRQSPATCLDVKTYTLPRLGFLRNANHSATLGKGEGRQGASV